MSEEIKISVSYQQNSTDPSKIDFIVRRVILSNGKMVKKFGLAKNGEWLHIPEGSAYPEECIFSLSRWGLE